MNKLRQNFDRFCARHSNWGIPNLMMFISIGIAVVYLFSKIDPSNVIYSFLAFDRSLILKGQVWRLITYILIPNTDNLLLLAIQLYFYYFIGKILEQEWGAFRFTIFYFSGVIITAVAAILLKTYASATYINLSLFLAYATLYPENKVLLFFIIPIKMKYLAWLDLAMTLLGVLFTTFPQNLFPLFALLNYILYFWPYAVDFIGNLRQRYSKQNVNYRKATKPNKGWSDNYTGKNGEKPYHHKCAVCGKTDTEYPDLDFRYCSRCNGYYCYCSEHINSHVHIQ